MLGVHRGIGAGRSERGAGAAGWYSAQGPSRRAGQGRELVARDMGSRHSAERLEGAGAKVSSPVGVSAKGPFPKWRDQGSRRPHPARGLVH